jgi:hypothetical protein
VDPQIAQMKTDKARGTKAKKAATRLMISTLSFGIMRSVKVPRRGAKTMRVK